MRDKQGKAEDKRIAIFHNFMDNIGGAEIVTLYLARELDATIYTTNIDMDKINKMGFEGVRIESIGRVPKKAPFRHQAAFYRFKRLDLSNKFDFFIISGDWAMSGAVKNQPNLWYVHSPLNEVWEFKDYIKKELLSFWKRPIYEVWVKYNRRLNLKYLEDVDRIVCNSKNTRRRIKRYYKKDAKMICPPVETKRYKRKKHKGYWLSVNRLSKAKRIEIQMKAFRKMPEERLVVVGCFEKGTKQFEEYKDHLERIRPPNVEIISWVKSEDLKRIYSECKGLIATAMDEDFGMSLIEAMACGKPVIAGKEGGYEEIVDEGVNGRLIEEIDEHKLTQAIKEMSSEIEGNQDKYSEGAEKKAKVYDLSKFIGSIKDEIKRVA